MWNSSGALVIPNGRRSRICRMMYAWLSSMRTPHKGDLEETFLTSTREKHFAELSLWSCSFRVGISCFGRWRAFLTVWLGSMHTRNFFGVFLISSFEHHGVGSFTLTRTPSRTYRSKAAFSFVIFATGILWIGILTGWTTVGPSWPRPSNVSAYWTRTSSICSWPGGGSRRFEGIVIGGEGDGRGFYGLVVVSWSCWRWLHVLRFPWHGTVFCGLLETIIHCAVK